MAETPIFKIPGGVDNLHPEDSLGEGTARKAVNVDISSDGDPRLRKGYTKLLDLIDSHSLFSTDNMTLLVENGWLKRYDNKSLVPIVEVSGELSYADINGTIYFSDGINLGRIIEDGSYRFAWVKNPTGFPTLAPDSDGSLPAGRYQIVLTNVDEFGLESGCEEGVVIEVDGGGIRISEIPQSVDAAFVRIYMTVVNGIVFHKQVDVPMGEREGVLMRHHLGKTLETQFASEMPAGDILEHHYGRLYSAVGSMLIYSEALRPGLTRILDNYYQLPSKINLIMSHSTGLFIACEDGVYYVPGGDPKQASIRKVSPLVGIPGTDTRVAASLLGLEQTGVCILFLSENGYVVCGAEGLIIPVNERQLTIPVSGKGASMFREESGIKAVVTTLQEPGLSDGVGVSDAIAFTVIRNGIEVPP